MKRVIAPVILKSVADKAQALGVEVIGFVQTERNGIRREDSRKDQQHQRQQQRQLIEQLKQIFIPQK
jgi:16S rRNA U1498 N3-methylase RsmE